MAAPASRVTIGRGLIAHARARTGRAAARIETLPAVAVVAVFIVAEWIAVLALARTVRHNGWIYYQGGDQLWYYTLGWLLGHGHLWQTPVGYGWPFLLAPISWVAGSNLASALPLIVLFNVLIVLPVAMCALYGIAVRIGGRLFAYWTLLLWLVVPFVGILYTNTGYHQRYTELTLPQGFGLTAMSDFPTMVAALVSLCFCARVVLGTPVLIDAVAGGVAGGFAIGIKPATTFFLVGPVLAFAARRYLPYLGAYLGGLLPAVVTLAVWKERGLGQLPVLAARPFTGLASGAPVLGLGLDKYFKQLTYHRLTNNIDLLREHFWSGHFLVWLFLAGLLGLLRRSPRAFLLLGGAVIPFTLAKASYEGASIEDASLFRLLMPCWPIFVVLLACLPFLFPGTPQRLPPSAPVREWLSPRARLAAVGAALAVTAVFPLVAVAAASTGQGADVAASPPAEQFPIPIQTAPAASARTDGTRVVLTWPAVHAAGGSLFYRIWRARATPSSGLDCPPSPGAPLCRIDAVDVGASAGTRFVDHPGRGRWVYRVAAAANWLNDPKLGDPYLAGRPVTVRVR